MNAVVDAIDNTEVVRGQVERIVYRGDNDWSVMQVRMDRLRMLNTVVGYSTAHPGEHVVARGAWRNDPNYGIQFVAKSITATKPNTPDGLVRYLSSGVIRGVGPATAKAIVETFGTEALAVLDQEPERLSEVRGIGSRKIAQIAESWAEQRVVSEIMLFLNEQHIPPYLCRRIYRKYEAKSIEVIRSDPFRLALEVPGIGFKTADKIAAQCGIPHNSPQRVLAGLVYVMQESASSGHCGMPRDDLLQKAQEFLGVPPALLVSVLDEALASPGEDRHLVCYTREDGTEVIALSVIAACETIVSRSLGRMLEAAVPWTIDADKAIDAALRELGASLSMQQREAVRMMLTHRVSVLTGGPGTGKTHTLRFLLHIFRKHKIRVHLAAPTGKAAQRASEVTGLPASTIHRLLGIRGPGCEPMEIEDGVLVIDESSMIDIYLMTSIVKAAKRVPVIFVGDVDQLPSVGPGQVLADMIRSGRIPVARLDQVFRQAAGSLIVRNAHRINRGLMPEKGTRDDNFFFLKVEEKAENGERLEPSVVGEQIASCVVELVAERLPQAYGLDPVRDIMVLSPMNITSTGVSALNVSLQQRLNPSPEKAVTRFGIRFGVGDKVIQTRNNYDLDVMNGDVGIIMDIHDMDDPASDLGKRVVVDFGGRVVEIPFDEMDSLRLAYCMTVHKSQGSQARAVVIPVTTQHYTMLQRNLFYTGVTRAQQLAVLVGVPRALAIAVRNDGALKRVTRLAELLAA